MDKDSDALGWLMTNDMSNEVFSSRKVTQTSTCEGINSMETTLEFFSKETIFSFYPLQSISFLHLRQKFSFLVFEEKDGC